MKIILQNKKLDFLTLLLFLILFIPSVLVSLYFPNVILEQGISHKIFYFHVPIAWVAIYGPILSSVFSILFILKKEKKWDNLSYSLNIISFLFALGVVISGPIWAYSAWGVFWDWTDSRLQSFFILIINLLSYFIFRNIIIDQSKKQLFSSFLTILCSLSAVITWGAIRWIENPGNHPSSVLGKGGMESDMRISFWFCVLGYHFLFLVLSILTVRFVKIVELKVKLKELLNS